MDNQLFELINQRSDQQDRVLDEIKGLIRDHTKEDEKYWKKIDIQEGQLSVLKWLFGGTITTAIGSVFAWFVSTMKGH